VIPVILSGGVGERLWPLSRERFPKQLQPLVAEQSLLQQTVNRLPEFWQSPIVVCNHHHRFAIAEQLRQSGRTAQAILLEPEGRNTAAAIAIAALYLADRGLENESMVVLPADHWISNPQEFQATFNRASRSADKGQLVVFGVPPESVETGYGYIMPGAAEGGDCFRVSRFVEKPEKGLAEKLIADGGLWNSGMLLAKPKTILTELAEHQSELLGIARKSLAGASTDLDFIRLEPDSFKILPNLSFDHAVLEKSRQVVTHPLNCHWSDVGSWQSLWQIGDADESGNVTSGDVIQQGNQNCYLSAGKRLLAVAGVSDLVVVDGGDAVLVTRRDNSQQIKQLTGELKRLGRRELVESTRSYRPWGYFELLDHGEGFQVKRISVRPGHRLSLQRHRHRSEHWVVVSGIATVIRDDERFELLANQSAYLPQRVAHRLENNGDSPLVVIEIQSGAYLGEDDIERLDDAYHRDSSE